MIEYHSHLAGRNGVNLKLRMRKQMEGWDFADLVSDQDPLPRVATLPSLGYGWVDFIRSINAVPIFGRGFGELIKPDIFPGMCSRWSSLPTERCLLAASNIDLAKIMDKFGDYEAIPQQLTQHLLWLPQPNPIMPCSYLNDPQNGAQKRHVDPVQVIWPKKATSWKSVKCRRTLPKDGAVVFGHSDRWGFNWSVTTQKEVECEFEDREVTAECGSVSSERIDSTDLSNTISNKSPLNSMDNSVTPSASTDPSTTASLGTVREPIAAPGFSIASKPATEIKQTKSLAQRLSPRLFRKHRAKQPEETWFVHTSTPRR